MVFLSELLSFLLENKTATLLVTKKKTQTKHQKQNKTKKEER